MSDPCKRCGDPDGGHEGSEEGTAGERNCNLFRIGTALEETNRCLERVVMCLQNLVDAAWRTK